MGSAKGWTPDSAQYMRVPSEKTSERAVARFWDLIGKPTLNAPADGAKVAFRYVAATHVLTISAGHGADNNVEWDGLRHDSRDPLYRTGISVGDYPIDHHHKRNPTAPQHLWFVPVPSFSVPLGALVPETVDGLVVADKAISVSNVANGTME